MPNLFVLIQQEEIPFSESASLQKVNHISYFGTRHIIITIDIPQNTTIEAQTIVGPKNDAPKQAIDGFFRKWENCGGKIIQNDKNYLFTKKAETKIAEEIAPEIIDAKIEEIALSWKEVLDIKPLKWSRPINSISAFLNEKPIQHRYSIKPVTLLEAKKLCNQYVSKNAIEQEIHTFEEKHQVKCTLKSLINELAWLYENPSFTEAEIPHEYLDLPREVLNLTIATNQRYILFEKDGKVYPQFLIVGKKHNDVILQGHIRTLRARLEDAKYYIEKDIKNFNISHTEEALNKIVFHQKYGSIAKRVNDMQSLAHKLFPNDSHLQKAIALSKNDLTSHTVQSFTELQGYCGGYFLQHLKVDAQICNAISQHYKPLNPNDSLPDSLLGRKLSFIDKLQKINALAEINEIPTSSRDPFAIRRDILSIIRICFEERWNFNSDVIHHGLQNFVSERVKLFAKDFLAEEQAVSFLKKFNETKRFA